MENPGQLLRNYRLKKGVGLRELARRAKMSPASVTSIEKGYNSPTLATFHRLLKALGTDFREFFRTQETPDDTAVFPPERRRLIADAFRQYAMLLPAERGMKFELVEEVISPSEAQSEWETHDHDVGGVVLSGTGAQLEIEGMGSFPVRKQDAFYIRAGQKHRLTNRGKKPLKLITVMCPPRY